MGLVTSSASTNNHNLYFSKDELAKILNLYSKGVSSGEWKDYAIDFNKNEAIFFIYKHSWATPYCVLIKSKEVKKRKIIYGLSLSNTKKSNFSDIDKLIKYLRRKQLKII